MKPISENLVEETWQEVGSFTPEQGSNEVRKLGQEQPDLLAFMLEFSDDFTQEVKELAIYMLVVVYRMFCKAHGKQIGSVSAEEIMASYDKNEKLILSLEGAHERFYDRIARIHISDQPYVMKYVIDALAETPEEDDPIVLTDDEMGILFLLFKTVVDVLNEAIDEGSPADTL